MRAIWHIKCPACRVVSPHEFELHNMIGRELIVACPEGNNGCGREFGCRPMVSLEARLRMLDEQEFTARCSFAESALISPLGGAR